MPECSPCLIPGCKHCAGKGQCTYCHPFGAEGYDSSCMLNCPEELPLYDEMPSKGGKKCALECENDRSVISLDGERCLYCG